MQTQELDINSKLFLKTQQRGPVVSSFKRQYRPFWTQQPAFTLSGGLALAPGQRLTCIAGSDPATLTHYKGFEVGGKLQFYQQHVSACACICVRV